MIRTAIITLFAVTAAGAVPADFRQGRVSRPSACLLRVPRQRKTKRRPPPRHRLCRSMSKSAPTSFAVSPCRRKTRKPCPNAATASHGRRNHIISAIGSMPGRSGPKNSKPSNTGATSRRTRPEPLPAMQNKVVAEKRDSTHFILAKLEADKTHTIARSFSRNPHPPPQPRSHRPSRRLPPKSKPSSLEECRSRFVMLSHPDTEH
jgi:hypothetical protein